MEKLQPIDVIFDSSKHDIGNIDNPTFVMDPPLDNIVAANLQWVSVPFSYYVIDRTNNAFDFSISVFWKILHGISSDYFPGPGDPEYVDPIDPNAELYDVANYFDEIEFWAINKPSSDYPGQIINYYKPDLSSDGLNDQFGILPADITSNSGPYVEFANGYPDSVRSDGKLISRLSTNKVVRQIRLYLTPGTYTTAELQTEICRQITLASSAVGRDGTPNSVDGKTEEYPFSFVDKIPGIGDWRSMFKVQQNTQNSKISIFNPQLPMIRLDNVQQSDFPEGSWAYDALMAGADHNVRVWYYTNFSFRFNDDLSKILGFSNDWQHSFPLPFYAGGSIVGATNTLPPNSTNIDDLPRTFSQGITGENGCNLIESNRINVHSSLANQIAIGRSQSAKDDVLTSIPVDTNYSAYILNVQTAEMYHLTRSLISQVSFYLTLGERRRYSNQYHNTFYGGNQIIDYANGTRTIQGSSIQPFLHMNGQPYMVCIRFYRDSGAMAQP